MLIKRQRAKDRKTYLLTLLPDQDLILKKTNITHILDQDRILSAINQVREGFRIGHLMKLYLELKHHNKLEKITI